jgi:Circadian oscillating protein COP23
MQYKSTTYCLKFAIFGYSIFFLNQLQSIAQPTGEITFFCGTNNGMPTTIALRQDKRQKPLIRWSSSVGGVDPMQRCKLISKRFQSSVGDQGLRFFTPGTWNGHYVVCAVKNIGDPCAEDFLFTVKSRNDARQITETLRELGSYVGGPIDQSDQVYIYFNVKQYLASDKNDEFDKPLLDKI